MATKCMINISTPSYAEKYKRELQSQKAYAAKYGYDFYHININQENPGTAKWSKVENMIHFLDRYYIVLLLDSDCYVRPNAPDIISQIEHGKTIYMAKGYSGRFNSGVILAVSSVLSREYFRKVLSSRNNTVSAQSFVNKTGENGHIIEISNHPKYHHIFKQLSFIWNNNKFPQRADFIRHYSSGPMKAIYPKL